MITIIILPLFYRKDENAKIANRADSSPISYLKLSSVKEEERPLI
jgi:hypothetical protein